jgi:UDP-N-acetyl-D-mannosaminuronate dehydrogenase
MISLTIGAGEIGKSLHSVLKNKHTSYIRDVESAEAFPPIDVLNICYPPIKDFVKITQAYIKQYKPKLTIIHSTVAPGTTREVGRMVVHSPVHGKHPNLEEGIKTFVKFIGANNAYSASLAYKFLTDAGIQVKIVANSETSELSKILCTSYYGWNILFMKEVAKICEQYDVPFHSVYGWNEYYNQGYTELGMSQFVRPVLEPIAGPIGGHCVVNNCDLLKSFITDTIKEKNKEYEQ